jgi:hypothetical protein
VSENFEDIKMHGATIKITKILIFNYVVFYCVRHSKEKCSRGGETNIYARK